MKKAFIALVCAGSLVFAGHPFNTDDAGVVGDRETEIEVSVGTDFIEDGDFGAGVGLTYGIADRFHIGIGNGWRINKNDKDDRGFETPELGMKFVLVPDIFAVKASSALNGDGFAGFLLYTGTIESSQTGFNVNAGFESNGGEENAFAYAFSVVQPINSFFVGGELFGSAFKDMEDDDKKPFWQLGLGYDFDNPLTLSLGFGGSFVTNDDLNITLGLTIVLGGE